MSWIWAIPFVFMGMIVGIAACYLLAVWAIDRAMKDMDKR